MRYCYILSRILLKPVLSIILLILALYLTFSSSSTPSKIGDYASKLAESTNRQISVKFLPVPNHHQTPKIKNPKMKKRNTASFLLLFSFEHHCWPDLERRDTPDRSRDFKIKRKDTGYILFFTPTLNSGGVSSKKSVKTAVPDDGNPPGAFVLTKLVE